MITLEELKRLAVNLFLADAGGDISLLCLDSTLTSLGITMSVMYNNYVRSFSSIDKRRQYIFECINMATEFRNYWVVVRCGDQVTIEVIQNKWRVVHLLVGKHKCVKNYLNAVDLEYNNIDIISLQEVRTNICCQYYKSTDSNSNMYSLHPLDKVKENISL